MSLGGLDPAGLDPDAINPRGAGPPESWRNARATASSKRRLRRCTSGSGRHAFARRQGTASRALRGRFCAHRSRGGGASARGHALNLFSFNSPLGAVSGLPGLRAGYRDGRGGSSFPTPRRKPSPRGGHPRLPGPWSIRRGQRDPHEGLPPARHPQPKRAVGGSPRRRTTNAPSSWTANRATGVDGSSGPMRGMACATSSRVARRQHLQDARARLPLGNIAPYVPCPSCGGDRLNEEARLWEWKGHRLPALYRLPVDDLLAMMEAEAATSGDKRGRSRPRTPSSLRPCAFCNRWGWGYLHSRPRSSPLPLRGRNAARPPSPPCLGTGPRRYALRA